MTLSSVVIVGGGQAGFQVAASLRQDGFAGRVTLIGDEPDVPYQRPPLSKAYLLGKIGADALRFRQHDFFDEHRIELLHDRATAIDRTNQRVVLASRRPIAYDHLVLALGAHNRALPVPGIELDGVFGLRTLADADGIARRSQSCPQRRRRRSRLHRTWNSQPWPPRAACRSTCSSWELASWRARFRRRGSELFRAAHERWGVKLDFAQGLTRIDGSDGEVTAIETTDRRALPADLVVFGIGVLPNVALAAEAGLDIENGIRVDTDLLTSDPSISAIGDCASFPSPPRRSATSGSNPCRTPSIRRVASPPVLRARAHPTRQCRGSGRISRT